VHVPDQGKPEYNNFNFSPLCPLREWVKIFIYLDISKDIQKYPGMELV
jgi:hypothetical protein